MSQPTRTTSLPTRPANGYRRPAVMGALSLAEHLIAANVPVPASITIDAPLSAGGKAVVKAMAHHDLDMLFAWQAAFGGTISHQLVPNGQVYSELTGNIGSGRFAIWTLRDTTPEQQVAERELAACWCAEHGPDCEWTPGTREGYIATIINYRLAVAA